MHEAKKQQHTRTPSSHLMDPIRNGSLHHTLTSWITDTWITTHARARTRVVLWGALFILTCVTADF